MTNQETGPEGPQEEENDAAPEAPRPRPSRAWIPVGLLCLVLGGGIGLLAGALLPVDSGHDHAGETAGEVWTCPMHPTVISDRAGACPVCGMDLVKKIADDNGTHDPVELARLGRVALNPTKRVLGNVATSPVQSRSLERSFRAPAQIVHDEQGLNTIAAWIPGRVERLFVEETGVRVDKGQKLLSIYSPELVTAQEEFLAASRGGEFTAGLRDQAQRKLRLWGMSRGQIARVERAGKPLERVLVYAPSEGTVTDRSVQEGQYVKEGQALLQLSTLTRVWLEAEVYEKDIPYVEAGADIEFTVSAFPGRTFAGRIELLHPVLDKATRTMRVRASFSNPDGDLRPGMYAQASFRAAVTSRKVPVVPVTAVIRTGKRAVVYVQVEPEVFEQREVTLGPRAQSAFVILSGLQEGETVVSSGGFLVDSEAQLLAGAYGPATQPMSSPTSSASGPAAPDRRPASGAASGPAEPSRPSKAASDPGSQGSGAGEADAMHPPAPGNTAASENGAPVRSPSSPAGRRSDAASERSEPSSKKSGPGKTSSPASKKSEPASKGSEPASKKSEPASKKSEPASKKSEPASKKSEPASKKSEPASKPGQPASAPASAEGAQ